MAKSQAGAAPEDPIVEAAALLAAALLTGKEESPDGAMVGALARELLAGFRGRRADGQVALDRLRLGLAKVLEADVARRRKSLESP